MGLLCGFEGLKECGAGSVINVKIELVGNIVTIADRESVKSVDGSVIVVVCGFYHNTFHHGFW